MRRTWLLIYSLTLLTAFNLQGQRIVENRLQLDLWHPGTVTLKDGSEVKGNINFNYLADIIRVTNGEQVKTFNHKQILGFSVFKGEENRQVNYKSLKLPIGDKIYEVVGEDDEKALLVSTVVDQSIVNDNIDPFYGPNRFGQVNRFNPNQTRTINRRAETFIIIDNTGKIDVIGTIVITPSKKRQLKSTIKKKQLISILERFKPDIREYLETNDINLRKRQQLIDTFMSIMNTEE